MNHLNLLTKKFRRVRTTLFFSYHHFFEDPYLLNLKTQVLQTKNSVGNLGVRAFSKTLDLF